MPGKNSSKAAYKKERYEFIENMFLKLESVPVHQVIGTYIELVPRGRHFMGLCPFHHDTRLGSFVVTPDKNIWKCFTCGDEYAGNAVKFVSLYKSIPYLEAAFDTALNFGVINRTEYENYSRKKYDTSFVENLRKRYSEKAKDEVKPKKAPEAVIHNVYLLMKQICTLSDEHRHTLETERKLPKERIEKDYFTFPYHWKQKDKVVDEIHKQLPQISDAVLQTVPGFFYDKKSGKISFAGYKGLGILIRNAAGMIQAVQIRKDSVNEGDSRYVWFSSSFAFYRSDEFSGGCGCGSPKDILWTDNLSRKTLCITEGRFKSEVLSSCGNTTISIQGVASWSGIEYAMQDIMKQQEINTLFIFLDSDIMGKHMLFLQSQKMVLEIQKRFPKLKIKYAFWHKDAGKGIDDYIHNGNQGKNLVYMDRKTAAEIGNGVFESALKQFGVSRLQDLNQNDAQGFEDYMQKHFERKVLMK